ncbi:hypothetical protein JCM8208_002653 [Rhodotorula glutinis]
MPPAVRGSASGQVFPCPDCDKTFSRKEYMARHHRSKHSREKPFQCEHCGHAFSRSDLLRRHYKTCAQAKAARGEGGEATAGSSTGSPAVESPPVASTSAMSLDLPPPPSNEALTRRASYSWHNQGPPPQQEEAALPVPPARFLDHANPGPPQYPPAPQPAPHYVPHRAYYPPPSTVSSSHTPSSSNGASTSPYSIATTASTTATTPDVHNVQLPSPPALSVMARVAAATAAAQPLAQEAAPPPPPAAPQTAPAMPVLAAGEQYPGYLHPTSAFKEGVAQHDTLAPGLSRTGSFTKDEVLASEVLQDLMRTPFGAPTSTPASPGYPWHGARAAQRADERPEAAVSNEAVALVDTSNSDWAFVPFSYGGGAGGGTVGAYGGYGGGPVSNKLEETPAAQQLAEYFNKGGVGGITALDLGFPTEPSIFPDWLINPKPVHVEPDMRRWWLPEQKFCLGYLYPWHVPPLPVLSGYARKATEELMAAVPILHGPSAVMNELPAHMAFALTVAGGAYEPEGQSFSNEMLVEKRVFLVRGFQEQEKSWEDRFASLQSLLLYQLLGLFHRDEQQRLLSNSFHSALIYMLRALDLPGHVARAVPIRPAPGMHGEVLEQCWRAWLELETRRRVCFIIFLVDLEHAAATNSPQLLSLSDLNIDLPASERAWKAENAVEWLDRSSSALYPRAIPFLAAVRALLSPTPPDPFSAAGVLIAELGRLSSFPLLVLSRTLSYLERKTQEALEQIDPFKNLLGGLGVYEGRESENRAVLERIKRGREILRSLPGGIARGGGEGWWNEIIPSAKDFVPAESGVPRSASSPRRSTSTASSSSSRGASSSSRSSNSTLPSPPSPAPGSLDELLAEFDEQPYTPYAGEGGANPGETYEHAQERLRKLAERRVNDMRQMMPEAFAPP